MNELIDRSSYLECPRCDGGQTRIPKVTSREWTGLPMPCPTRPSRI